MFASSSTTTLQPIQQLNDSDQTAQASTSSSVAETLTLRLVPKRRKKGVKWTDDTIDNEFLGKKSSKKCCIFHRRRQFGDWSDSDDSSCDEADCHEQDKLSEAPQQLAEPQPASEPDKSTAPHSER